MNLRTLLQNTHDYETLSSDQISSHLDQISKQGFGSGVAAESLEGDVSAAELQQVIDALIRFSDESFDGDTKAALDFLNAKVSANPQLEEMDFSEFVDSGQASGLVIEPKHIQWEDVIQIYNSEAEDLKSKTPEEMEKYEQRLERFLDYVENTEQGQEILHAIQEKHCGRDNVDETDKLKIHLVDQRGSMYFPDGQALVDVSGSDYLAFLDKETKEATSLSFERTALHEIIHASDKGLQFGQWYDDQNAEEYATQKTDEFARKYMPELGQRGVYDNIAGQQPHEYLEIKAIYGKEQIENDPELRHKLETMLDEPIPSIDPNKGYKEVDSPFADAQFDQGVPPAIPKL